MLKALDKKIIVKETHRKKENTNIIIAKNEEENLLVKIIALSKNIEQEGELKEGDFLIINKYAGDKFMYEDQEYISLNADNIFAKIEEE